MPENSGTQLLSSMTTRLVLGGSDSNPSSVGMAECGNTTTTLAIKFMGSKRSHSRASALNALMSFALRTRYSITVWFSPNRMNSLNIDLSVKTDMGLGVQTTAPSAYSPVAISDKGAQLQQRVRHLGDCSVVGSRTSKRSPDMEAACRAQI